MMNTYLNKTIMLLCSDCDPRTLTCINEAKILGYRIVLCSDTQDDSVVRKVDVFNQVDYCEYQGLIDIAVREDIDAAIPLFDKSVIAAANICEDLHLRGNSIDAANSLMDKNRFRALQSRLGVFCPRHLLLQHGDDILHELITWNFPVIIKPLFCSSSLGQKIIDEYNAEKISEYLSIASDYSRNGQVIIEEYIHPNTLRLIEGDVFLVNNEWVWDGIRNNYRRPDYPNRPSFDVYPPKITDRQLEIIKETISSLIIGAGATFGEFNFEGAFIDEDNFFVYEINPRQAGCYNPVQIEFFCGVNLTRLLLTTAVGDFSYFDSLKSFKRSKNNIIAYSVFSHRDGILDRIVIEDEIKSYIIQYERYPYERGDKVYTMDKAPTELAKISFKFDSNSDMEDYIERINRLVYVVLQEETVV